jgi:nucleoside 2-deoxyribosyltransferase
MEYNFPINKKIGNFTMNIYFACSITGGRLDESHYQKIVDFLIIQGHEVPTASLANEEVILLEGVIEAADVYHRDTVWIQGCDLLIAEVSTPSHGVGYEIGYALHLGKPVICLHRENSTVSKMITGNPDPSLQVFAYSAIEDAIAYLKDQLDNHTPA